MSAIRIGTLKLKLFAPALLLCGVLGGQAFADCSTDIGALSKKRQDLIDELNRTAKAAPKGQLDPTTSCPKLRTLAAAEQTMLAYMQKNKDWCNIPDDVVNNFAGAAEKSKQISAKACQVAEQMKKNQQLGAAQAPKLPSGPL